MADRSSSNIPPSGSSAGGTPGADRAPEGPPPGLGEQFGRTRAALIGLIRSHINLAKAEFSEIADEIKRAAALGGIALFLLFLTGPLIVVGLLLFLGEAIFGSIGWEGDSPLVVALFFIMVCTSSGCLSIFRRVGWEFIFI